MKKVFMVLDGHPNNIVLNALLSLVTKVVDDGNRDIVAAIMAAHARGAGVATNVIKTRALKMNEAARRVPMAGNSGAGPLEARGACHKRAPGTAAYLVGGRLPLHSRLFCKAFFVVTGHGVSGPVVLRSDNHLRDRIIARRTHGRGS
jgi:hypothetical protein